MRFKCSRTFTDGSASPRLEPGSPKYPDHRGIATPQAGGAPSFLADRSRAHIPASGQSGRLVEASDHVLSLVVANRRNTSAAGPAEASSSVSADKSRLLECISRPNCKGREGPSARFAAVGAVANPHSERRAGHFETDAVAKTTSRSNSGADQAPQIYVDLIIELGIGGTIQPEYEGSEDYEVTPWPVIGFGYLVIPGLITIGNPEAQVGGFPLGPSFNYTSDRDFNDDPDLFGLGDVDATFEAGLRASYEWTNVEVWGEARYAFGGADGIVGESA